MEFISLWERRGRANFLEGLACAHQLREHGEFASIGKRHRDRVGSRLTNCKLPHIPLLLMGLSLRGVLQLVITATVKTPSATAKI